MDLKNTKTRTSGTTLMASPQELNAPSTRSRQNTGEARETGFHAAALGPGDGWGRESARGEGRIIVY